MPPGTEQTATTKSQIRDAPQVLPRAEEKQSPHSSHDHGGIYSHLRQTIAASGAQEPPPSNFAPIFRSAEFSHPVNDEQKRRALLALQQNYGNHYVQRVLADESANPSNTCTTLIQRSESPAAPGSDSPAAIGQGNGHPLDSRTQDSMSASFNQDFSSVRVHDNPMSHQAARDLNARAFTTGRDIYFSPGAYNPNSDSGRKLLAHELTHVAQQSGGASGVSASGFSVSHPSDPLEREADRVSDAVVRGEMFPPISTSSTSVVHRTAPAAPSAPARSATPAGGAPVPASGSGGGTTTAGGTGAGTTPAARAGDFSFSAAGLTVTLPIRRWLEQQVSGSIPIPDSYLKKAAFPGFRLTTATIDLDENKMPNGATIGVGVAIPPLTGDGTLTVDKNRNASGSVHVVFSPKKIPGLKQTEIDARITKDDFAFGTSVDFDLPKVTGNLQYKYQDHKHSGKGKANYQGSKMRGSIEIIMSEAGLISGSGMLDMELFKGLQGQANVAVDEKRNIAVQGKLTLPGEVVLFPEKKYEKSFFNFEKKFPIWGITIPVIDVNVGIFAEIHAGAGFRSKFGPGVLRGIELTGEFGTDPEAATEFGLGGEFYVPAAAEVVANVGGGIGLGLAIADITGGIEAIGVAGLYTALTVRPQFKYAGGKYTISGMAELAGVAQLKFGINAFAKIDVGVWLFKGTVWRKDWTLAEWIWNTGLNVALRANISYTLGDDFAPDISFETGQVDPEKFIKDAMPESGSPVPAPPKPAVPEKASFTAEGAQGTGTGAPGEAPAAQTPGAPGAKTTPGTVPATTAGGPTAGGPPAIPGAPGAEAPLDPEARSAAVKQKVQDELATKIQQPVSSFEKMQSTISALFSKYQPEGLKALKVDPLAGSPEDFQITAEASVGKNIGIWPFVRRTFAWTLSVLASKTYLRAEYEIGGQLKRATFPNLPGRLHSEERFRDSSFLQELIAAARAHEQAHPGERTTVLLEMNRTPCGAQPPDTSKNCVATLMKIAADHQRYLVLDLQIVGIYRTNVLVLQENPQSGEKETVELLVRGTTFDELVSMAQTQNIRLGVLRVWETIKQKDPQNWHVEVNIAAEQELSTELEQVAEKIEELRKAANIEAK